MLYSVDLAGCGALTCVFILRESYPVLHTWPETGTVNIDVLSCFARLETLLAVLGLSQTAGLLALQALATHADLTAHVRDIRGWAVAGPVLIFATVMHVARARR